MSIRDTITVALAEHGLTRYAHDAEPVIQALEAREDGIIASLREQAVTLGATEEQVDTILVNAGLMEPEPVVQVEQEGDLEARVSRMEEAINELTALARRHLGASV